ncbi:MAG TPA: hypothetical protein VIH47_04705 [Solirubrobacterales bacterium]
MACLISLFFVATAQASFEDPPVKLGAESGNLESSAEYLLENSPRKISGIESTAESEALYKTVAEPPPSADALVQDEIEAETPSLLRQVGAWLWNKVPEAAVVVGGGWAGWEIGSLIYGTFFEESKPETHELSESYFASHWVVTTPGEGLLSDETGNIYAPDKFGMLGYNKSIGFGWISESGCGEIELYGDGERLYAPGWFSQGGCKPELFRHYVLWKPFEAVQCGKAGVSCPGIEPVLYEGEGQPTAPTAEALRESLKEALESGEYPEYNRLYNFEQEPENYPDPRITEKKVDDKERRCDRGTPSFENPGGNESPEPFAKKEESAFSVTTRPEGYEAPVYLRWGTTYWKPGREGFEGTPFVDDWGGWGWRHVIAKHGWSALDREETEVALDIGTPQPTAKEGKYVYEAPDVEPGSGGAECIRKVVVDFETGEEDPAPRGIVTSYNVVK